MNDYSPTTFGATKNTLAGFRPGGMTHPVLDRDETAEFQAERMLEAGYVIVHDEERAAIILAGRKT